MTAMEADLLRANGIAVPRPVNPWLIAVVVSMATFMEVLDTSIANVALQHIAGNLGAGQDEATWVLTSYLVSNAIIMPMSGWLASALGRKRFYMSCVALFTFSSLLCGLAPSLGWLLFFRVLQGVGGGGLAPSEQSILADTFSPKQRGLAFAVYGLAVVFAPAIGPTLGGWITDNYNWRWIFFINIPVGAVSLFLTSALVSDSVGAQREHEAVRKRGFKVDYLGFVFIALGIGSLQVVLDKGQEDDWFGSNFIIGFTILAVAGLTAAIIRETMFAQDPIVDLRLYKSRNFLSTNILMFVVGFVLTSTTQLLPQFVQQILHYDATQAGMTLMGGGIALMIMMPVAGILAGKVPQKYLMTIGILTTAAAMYHMTSFDAQVPFKTVMWARVYQAMALPLFFVPLNTIAYSDLPPGKSNNASALLNLCRNLGGGIGISAATTILDRRSQFHFSVLSAHFNNFDLPFRHQLKLMTSQFSGGGLNTSQAMHQAMAVMRSEAQTQALLLSYLDVFKIMSIGCVIVALLVLMTKRIRPGQHVEAPAH